MMGSPRARISQCRLSTLCSLIPFQCLLVLVRVERTNMYTRTLHFHPCLVIQAPLIQSRVNHLKWLTPVRVGPSDTPSAPILPTARPNQLPALLCPGVAPRSWAASEFKRILGWLWQGEFSKKQLKFPRKRLLWWCQLGFFWNERSFSWSLELQLVNFQTQSVHVWGAVDRLSTFGV